MDAALAFYRDGLGLEVAFSGESAIKYARRIWNMDPERVKVVFLKVPNTDTFVELFEFQGLERHPASARPADYGAGHMCLFVDDLDALHARLTAAGYRSRAGAVVTIEEGPHAGSKVAYMLDPDGYHVELYQRATDIVAALQGAS
jgi:lactoylglutathione lyase